VNDLTLKKPIGRGIMASVGLLMMTLVVSFASPPASASVSTTSHNIPGSGVGGVMVICEKSGFECTRDGYTGLSDQYGVLGWGSGRYWSWGSDGSNGTKHNCTTYAAYRIMRNGYAYPGWTWGAEGWASKASAVGTTVDQSPAVGAVAQWGKLGSQNRKHVAYVEAVNSDGSIDITDDSDGGGTRELRVAASSAAWPDNFIHFKDVAAAPVAVQNGGFESGNGTWRVMNNPGGVVNREVYSNPTRARTGAGFMEANTSVGGGSVGQDTGVYPNPGKYYSLRVWVRNTTDSGSPFSVTVALWALGGSQEQATTTASIGSKWTPVDVVLRPVNSGHSQIRVELYMNTNNQNVNFDDVVLSASDSDPRTNTANPIGNLDSSVSNATGKVTVRGWSFDPNYPTTSNNVHIYIGGSSGQPGAVGYDIGAANLTRPDVELAHPYAGSLHGFETTLTTSITGTTQVCAYGINVGQGNNAMLGGSCKTVTIESGPTTPSAPAITSIAPSSGTLAVSFAPPASNGGSAITNYQYSTNGGTTWVTRSPAATTSPLPITSLTNGSTYSIKLRAINSVGVGESSSTTIATACTSPSAPAISSINRGNTILGVNFTAPVTTGGCPVVNYQYSTNGGATWITRSPVATTTPLTITGLTNGTSYWVRLRGVNAAGAGIASAAVNRSPTTTVPESPAISSVVPSNGALTVNFTAPTDNGGATITNYSYSTNGGTTWITRAPASAASPITISGLTNGVQYTIAIRAVNSVGNGVSSAPVVATPATTPGAPTISSASPNYEALSVSFSAPTSTGDLPISNYQYSLDGGTTWITRAPASAASPLSLSSLTSGGSYTIRLRAVNSLGFGAPSTAVVGTPLYWKTLTINGCNTYGMWCDGNPVFSALPVAGATNIPKVELLNNGVQFSARCWSEGVTTYNYATWDLGPNPYDSTIYYYSRTTAGNYGWVPDTWSVRDKWNKAGLRRC